MKIIIVTTMNSLSMLTSTCIVIGCLFHQHNFTVHIMFTNYKLQLTNLEINSVKQETEYHWIRGAHFIDHDPLNRRLEVINIIAF